MGFFDNLSYAYNRTKSYTPMVFGGYNSFASNYRPYSFSTNYKFSFMNDYLNLYASNNFHYSLPTFSSINFDLKSSPTFFNFSYKPLNYNFNSYDFIDNYSYGDFNYSYTPHKSNYIIPSSNHHKSNLTKTNFKRANTGDLQLDLAQNAFSYVGKVNSDKAGNRLFSNGVSQAWCADFVTYVTKQTFGDKLPSSFGSSSVSGLRSWAENNGCYIPMASSGKQNFIKTNIRVGDIMVEKRNGKSHTGIVKEVAPDGSWFKVVEGNSSNKVQTVTYAANSSTLSGFISLDKYCA